jgi:hypothetical protein
LFDMSAVPGGLEDPVGEAQAEDVEHGLLGQEVVDSENHVFREVGGDEVVERSSVREACAEWLLNDDSARGLRLQPASARSVSAKSALGRARYTTAGPVVHPRHGQGNDDP